MRRSALLQDWIDPPGASERQAPAEDQARREEWVFRGSCSAIHGRGSSCGLQATETRQALQQADCASGRLLRIQNTTGRS